MGETQDPTPVRLAFTTEQKRRISRLNRFLRVILWASAAVILVVGIFQPPALILLVLVAMFLPFLYVKSIV